MQPKRRRTLTGLTIAFAGIVALVGAWWFDGRGFDVNVVWFALFAVAHAALSYRSVEVNDRLHANSSVMPLLTAGAAFVLDSGHSSVVFPVALIAAAGLLERSNVRERQVFQPVGNFGQLVIAATAAALIMQSVGEWALRETDTVSWLGGTQGRLFVVGALVALSGAVVNSWLSIMLVRVAVRLAYGKRNVLPWSGMMTIAGTQVLMGLLGGLLGAVLVVSSQGGSDAILPLILVIYTIGHLVVSSYAELREAHESTLRGFVKSLEARDLYTRGHTERVAYFAQMIGEQLGFTGTQLEHIRWAALIHDVGKLAIPIEIMQKQGKLDDAEYRTLRVATHRVDDLLSEVDFLRPMVEVASGTHPRLPHEDFGQVGHRHTTRPSLEQRVLAVADAFDAMVSTRGYRMSMSQRAALDALRRDDTVLYDNDVLDALERALATVGERYGPPDLDLPEMSSEVARATG
jgi:hypothetical protein